MFGNIGWGEIGILVIAALVILGPERLPGALRWTSSSLRQVRDYASGATKALSDELGPEFEDLRGPLSDLQQLRGTTPKSMITKHLLDGDDSLFKNFSSLSSEISSDVREATRGTSDAVRGAADAMRPRWDRPDPAVGAQHVAQQSAEVPVERLRPATELAPGEAPPFDPDAT